MAKRGAARHVRRILIPLNIFLYVIVLGDPGTSFYYILTGAVYVMLRDTDANKRQVSRYDFILFSISLVSLLVSLLVFLLVSLLVFEWCMSNTSFDIKFIT